MQVSGHVVQCGRVQIPNSLAQLACQLRIVEDFCRFSVQARIPGLVGTHAVLTLPEEHSPNTEQVF